MLNSVKIRSVEAEFLHADGQADEETEAGRHGDITKF